MDTGSEIIKVLDRGFVRLVSHMGDDLAVVRNARNSHDAAWRAGESEGSDRRLINYLWKNRHTTPFEAVTFTFEVKAPIFVFRQWHRHRTWSYNEVSARYTELPEDFYLPDPEMVGLQSTTNKQGRINTLNDTFFEVRRQQVNSLRLVCRDAFGLYNAFLADGWPRELARLVLPVSTYSKMFATVNLLNLFRFLTLRDDPHAQYEIRVYAEALKELVKPIVPVCIEAYNANKGVL